MYLDIFRVGSLSLLVVAAVVALDPAAGFGADNMAAPATSSANSAPDSSPSGNIPTPPNAAISPSGGNVPGIVEWLNQTVRLRAAAQALDRPSSDGKPLGSIRAGAEVKAIGIVSGGQWVQIELPDQRHAYVSTEAVELGNSAGPPSAGQQPASAKAATTEAATSEATSAAAVLRGPVTKVPNAATLVVADQRIRLSGIDPGPPTVLSPFETWVRAQGPLVCEPDAQTGRYRCFTSGGIDVAEAAILNGAGRVGDGATPEYRERETEARQERRGLWQGP
jgi:endonuclease YncB( thermonuclease family)